MSSYIFLRQQGQIVEYVERSLFFDTISFNTCTYSYFNRVSSELVIKIT